MKILVIGNSTKFIKFIRSIYEVTEISVISWRSLPDFVKTNSDSSESTWDLLLVAGYDYSISLSNLDEYLYKNVDCAYYICKKYANDSTIIVYINTSNPKKQITFSRYLYAKMLLGCKLSELPGCIYILSFPTILQSGKINIIGGLISQFLFNLVDKCSKVGKVEINSSAILNLKIFNDINKKPFLPKPLLLKIRRTLLIDRILRFTIG